MLLQINPWHTELKKSFCVSPLFSMFVGKLFENFVVFVAVSWIAFISQSANYLF